MIFLKRVLAIGSLFIAGSALAASNLDGIYQWNSTTYLSVHSSGSTVIATIYFNEVPSDGRVDFTSSGGARLTTVNLDSFELLSGSGSGQSARVSGTRFHRACDITYTLLFNADTTLTVTTNSISKNALGQANPLNINCNTNLGNVGDSGTIPKIF